MSEEWFLEHSRILAENFQFTDRPVTPADGGYRTTNGVLTPGPQAGYTLGFNAWINFEDRTSWSFSVNINNSIGYKYLNGMLKQTQRSNLSSLFGLSVREKRPKIEWVRRRTIAGLAGGEQTYVPANQDEAADRNYVRAGWDVLSRREGALQTLGFNLADGTDLNLPAKLGRWEAITNSARPLPWR